MHKLIELKDRLCEELEEYAEKNKFDLNALDAIDKLSHSVKSLICIIENEDADGGGYSGNWPGDMRNVGGHHMDGDGVSYARGRGRNARRDRMGRYSRAEDETIAELRETMESVHDEHIRRDIKSIIDKLERM